MSHDDNANAPAPLHAVHAAAVKIPQFTPTDPEWFFAFCEAQFRLKGVTGDDTKYDYIVTNLPADVASRVLSTLKDPPADGKFETIKRRLLKEYTLSTAERAAVLLDLPGLGDMRPSQLFTKMSAYVPAEEAAVADSFLFRELFLRQLPPDVRAHLADKAELSTAKLAEEADRYFTTAGQRILAVAAAVTASPRPSRSSSKKQLCFYHTKFGDKARRCRSPCSWAPEN